MNKWNIDITLKGSGSVKHCTYRSVETLSGDVIRKLFHEKQPNDWVSLYSHNENSVTYICVGEIAAVDISEGDNKR